VLLILVPTQIRKENLLAIKDPHQALSENMLLISISMKQSMQSRSLNRIKIEESNHLVMLINIEMLQVAGITKKILTMSVEGDAEVQVKHIQSRPIEKAVTVQFEIQILAENVTGVAKSHHLEE
jgi:hypothetical protein